MKTPFPYEQYARPALDWIARSIEANSGHGSSAHLFMGKWSPPYPETTGYLIETMLDYAAFLEEPRWREYALQCGEWLLSVQHADGSFPSLYANSGQPSVFNTGMILFGLARLHEMDEEKYSAPLRRATAWMLSQLEDDGSWAGYSYVPGFIPSYYNRAVWGVLEACRALGDPAAMEAIDKALSFYAGRFEENGFVKHWGFHPGKPAFTHTIAYTWRGFWEAARLLQRPDIQLKVQQGLTVLDEMEPLPGRIATDGSPDFSFSCLTGNAQLSVLAARIFDHTGEDQFLKMADRFFLETAAHQVKRTKSAYYGGIAGSQPLWGPYQRLRYPNWAAKFFLDACLLLWRRVR
jgi:hypothetical protein